LYFCFSFGQTKKLNGITSTTGDTSLWYKNQIKQLKKLSLPLLDTSSNKEYYRVWTNRQVIDIWKNSNGTFGGNLTAWTDEYVPYNEKPTNRTYIKVVPLTSDTAQFVQQLFLSSGILNLPTDNSIKSWRQGFDGITYIIEQSSKDSYSFKTYWTPKAQGSLKEAIQVQSFIDSVFSIVRAQDVWKSFANTIPYECYINGGPGIACKVLTTKERKNYIKERKNYRQQVHLQ
jgi:hypothetical protein